ncbi:hypothetical protein O181_004479 [Austropuccinia psidii MF-1]|uniref:Uncharacterized protein n=1 Tax=Austropuccinia psidii MF-1 TaxID=1389203 RepID=A0A9Q3BGA5_9BASI|nr:hypothetical protein [Austropuccinia psidii MF-1]
MSASTHAKKAANDNTEPKTLSKNNMYSMLNSLKNEVMLLKSAHSSDATGMQSLQMVLSFPLPASSPCSPLPPMIASCRNLTTLLITLPRSRATGQVSCLRDPQPRSSLMLSKHVAALETILKNSVLSAKCLDADQKLIWCPRPNNMLALLIRCTFAMFKKLGIEANELEGLLAQAAFHAPATLDQLVTMAILEKGEEKPNSTFVGQVFLNASTKAAKNTRQLSPFVYRVAYPPTTPIHSQRQHSPGPSHPWRQSSNIRQPPTIFSTNSGPSAFTVVDPGIVKQTARTLRGSQTTIHAKSG